MKTTVKRMSGVSVADELELELELDLDAVVRMKTGSEFSCDPVTMSCELPIL